MLRKPEITYAVYPRESGGEGFQVDNVQCTHAQAIAALRASLISPRDPSPDRRERRRILRCHLPYNKFCCESLDGLNKSSWNAGTPSAPSSGGSVIPALGEGITSSFWHDPSPACCPCRRDGVYRGYWSPAMGSDWAFDRRSVPTKQRRGKEGRESTDTFSCGEGSVGVQEYDIKLLF